MCRRGPGSGQCHPIDGVRRSVWNARALSQSFTLADIFGAYSGREGKDRARGPTNRTGRQANMIDDINLHEWAEYNVPAELRERVVVLSPFARRVLAPAGPMLAAAAEADSKRRLPTLGTLLLPGLGFGPIPKP